MNSQRAKYFPKQRHFGFKRPVFIDMQNDDKKENEEDKENEDIKENDENIEKNKDKETKVQFENQEQTEQTKKTNIHLLSFSISTELLSIQESPSIPDFDWIHESESKEKLFNESNFIFEEPDFC